MPLTVPPTFSNLGGAPADNAALAASLALKADLEGGKVPASQLPSYVDDVLEYANVAAFPGTGAAGVIYVALDTSKTYRWSGSAYVFTAGSLAAASQAEMEAGTEAAPREMSPLLVAQAIAALGGGGGASIALPLQAWVETTGNDGTAEAGNPAKPYETMAAAYTAGARVLHLGAGTFAGLSQSGNIEVSVLGHGRGQTIVTVIESTNGGTIEVHDLGVHSFTCTAISTNGVAPGAGTNTAGGNAGQMHLHNVLATDLNLKGGKGSDGGVGINPAAGGAGGTLHIYGHVVVTGTLSLISDGGGAPYDDMSTPQDGAACGGAGSITGHEGSKLYAASIALYGGAGSNGVNGGLDGAGNSAGVILADELHCLNLQLNCSTNDTYPGSLTARKAYVATMAIGGSSINNGTLEGSFMHIPTISDMGTPQTTSLYMSHVAGSPVGIT